MVNSLYIVLFVVLVSLVGCSNPTALTTPVSSTTSPSVTHIATPGLVPPTFTPSPTRTLMPPTPTAVLPSLTFTSTRRPIAPSPLNTATPTRVPVSTLGAKQQAQFVADMLKTNGGCELPCWWGITPGQTAWQVLRNRFTAYGSSVFDVPSTTTVDYHISHAFVQKNGVVESIQVTGEIRRSA